MDRGNFVSGKWLLDNIENCLIIDMRGDIKDKTLGETVYKKGHIKGAIYLSLDRDLVGEKGVHGGSRPLPKVEDIKERLEEKGITPSDSIVIYDDNMIMASRGAVTLRYFGYKDVKVLDGGLKAYIESGGKLEVKNPQIVGKKIDRLIPKKDMVVSMEEVREVEGSSESVVVECRGRDRYLGENETLYKKSGHIKGAISIPASSLLTPSGTLKKRKELEEIFHKLNKREGIYSCGSGVNASLNYLVGEDLGYKGRIYIGSFSDWISYDENTVTTVDEG